MDWASRAALNNALWCDVVCRTHGADPRIDKDMWTCETRTPTLFPDAVSLTCEAPRRDLLARIDVSTGCSIKDSFSNLELEPFGFAVLFDATWLVLEVPRSLGSSSELDWEVVVDVSQFIQWETAWRAHGSTGVLTPAILDVDGVSLVACRSNAEVIAGGVVTYRAGVIGLSNTFATSVPLSEAVSGVVDVAAASHPGVPVVTYERDDEAAPLMECGFTRAGALRVWTNDGR